MENEIIFGNRTYGPDLELFNKLGLTPWVNAPHGKNHAVGTVKGKGTEDHYEVKVSVCCLPAQCWDFEIRLFRNDEKGEVERQRIKLSTGSGYLSDFWPTVELLLDNMLVIKEATQPAF
jgi:hypothetical protein